jgi:hypothetical protein
MPLLTVDEAEPGAMTLPAISNMFKLFKNVQSLDLSAAKSLANEVISQQPQTHNALLNLVSRMSSKLNL